MTARPCLECGTPTLRTRCPPCESARQRTRNARRVDRYGADHRMVRREWVPRVDTGTVPCGRCTWLIAPGMDWHLDHLDDGTYWPSHARCNEAARRNV